MLVFVINKQKLTSKSNPSTTPSHHLSERIIIITIMNLRLIDAQSGWRLAVFNKFIPRIFTPTRRTNIKQLGGRIRWFSFRFSILGGLQRSEFPTNRLITLPQAVTPLTIAVCSLRRSTPLLSLHTPESALRDVK